MSEIYTKGRWRPTEGREDQFVEAWSTFAAWASARPGAGTLRLVRDVRAAGMFESFGEWEDIDAVRAWKGSPEFRERLSRVLQHVEEFEPTELALVAIAEDGDATAVTPPEAEPVHAP
jgi:heme-degrading monooxygenase HmoA